MAHILKSCCGSLPAAMIGVLFCAFVIFTPAAAETSVSEAEFEELSFGRTLHFERFGLPYGSEQFLDNRKTLWQTDGGQCQRGIWYQSDGLICFLYEESGGPVCWQVTRHGGRLLASRSRSDGSFGEPIELSGVDTEPLNCPGPDLGV